MTEKGSSSGKKQFFTDILSGFGMGIAFIIPGFSGGSVAAILGIYERLIGAIAGIFKSFRKSVITLLPVFVGMVLGIISLMYPLEFALGAFPLPTVCIFVGLAIGGLPAITDKLKGRITLTNIFAFIIPAILTLALILLPTGADVDLLNLDFGGYLLLFVIGVVGSCALVIPGISGSMILMILGYYYPILNMITDNFLKGQNMLPAFLVLASVGLGIVVGFIGISVIMKVLLDKYQRGTYFAILGFIIGSIPTIFITTVKDYYIAKDVELPTSPIYWIVSVLLLALGFTLAFLFVKKAKQKAKSEADE